MSSSSAGEGRRKPRRSGVGLPPKASGARGTSKSGRTGSKQGRRRHDLEGIGLALDVVLLAVFVAGVGVLAEVSFYNGADEYFHHVALVTGLVSSVLFVAGAGLCLRAPAESGTRAYVAVALALYALAVPLEFLVSSRLGSLLDWSAMLVFALATVELAKYLDNLDARQRGSSLSFVVGAVLVVFLAMLWIEGGRSVFEIAVTSPGSLVLLGWLSLLNAVLQIVFIVRFVQTILSIRNGLPDYVADRVPHVIGGTVGIAILSLLVARYVPDAGEIADRDNDPDPRNGVAAPNAPPAPAPDDDPEEAEPLAANVNEPEEPEPGDDEPERRADPPTPPGPMHPPAAKLTHALTVDDDQRVSRNGKLGDEVTWVFIVDGQRGLQRSAVRELSTRYTVRRGVAVDVYLSSFQDGGYKRVSNVVHYDVK